MRRFDILNEIRASIRSAITSASCTCRSAMSSPGTRCARSRSRSIARTASPRFVEAAGSDRGVLHARPAPLRRYRYSRGRDVRVGLRARARQGSARSNELGAQSFQNTERRFSVRLSTSILEPIKWIDAFCWRRLCSNERLGYYVFWREIGTRMGIKDIPPTYEGFQAWTAAYENANFRFADTNQQIGRPRAIFLPRGRPA